MSDLSVISDEEFPFPVEDLDHFTISDEEPPAIDLSTGISSSEISCGAAFLDGKRALSDEVFGILVQTSVRAFVYRSRTRYPREGPYT